MFSNEPESLKDGKQSAFESLKNFWNGQSKKGDSSELKKASITVKDKEVLTQSTPNPSQSAKPTSSHQTPPASSPSGNPLVISKGAENLNTSLAGPLQSAKPISSHQTSLTSIQPANPLPTISENQEISIQPTLTQIAVVTEAYIPKRSISKRKITNIPYGTSNKRSDFRTFDFLSETEIKELFETKNAVNALSKNKKNNSQVSSDDLTVLLDKGYTKEEINTFHELGITMLALKKLASPELKLNIFESIEVITTFIKMGKVESEKLKATSHDLVLLIGNTGSGKSTAVNYLHGCEMEKKSDGIKSFIVVKENSQKKEVVAIGHGKSKTFIPSTIASPEQGISFCDCPGFSDNRGQEISIANAVNILHMIENAKSVKIVLLIDYKTIEESRGNGIDGLIKTLNNLFGSNNSLVENAVSILIGITQVPLNIDDEKITIEKVRGILQKNDQIPKFIMEKIKILDPLERRANEKCARADWLENISNLIPVKDHQTHFNTVLNADDTLMLINISKKISKQINKDLTDGNYVNAANKLEQIHYLKIIRHSEIDRMFEDNIREINHYTADVKLKLKKFEDSYNWDKAYEAIKQYKQFVIMFKEIIPSLKDDLVQLIRHVNQKLIENHQTNISTAISNLAKSYDQNRDLQRRLAYPLHQLLNQSEPAITDAQALPFLGGYLKEILSLDCSSLGALIEDVCKHLTELKLLADKLQDNKIIQEGEEKVAEELRRIGKIACQIHRENTLEQLKGINIIILEQLEKFKLKVKWEINGKNILSILKTLQNKAGVTDIASSLAALTKNQSIQQEAELLLKQITTAQNVIDTIVTDPALSADVDNDIPPLFKIVHENLLKIKAQLTTAQQEEELKIRKEQEQKDVEAAIEEIKVVIEQVKYDAFRLIKSRLSTFNPEQAKLLKQTKDISLLLSEKAQCNFDFLKLKLNWEINGHKILDIIKDLHSSSLNDVDLEKIFSKMSAIADITPYVQAIHFMLIFNREFKDYLQLDSSLLVKTMGAHLAFIQGELKKKHAEEEKCLNEEKKQKEASDLVACINNQLLPNGNFKELNVAISRLIQIAPAQLQTIILKTKIGEYRRDFYEQLAANNYDAVNGKLVLLSELRKHLGAILVQLNIVLELKGFTSAILEHVSKASTTVLRELGESLSDEAISNPQSNIKMLPSLGAYFNAVSNFKNIDGVSQLTNNMINACVKSMQDLANRYVNSTNIAVFCKLLMQIQCISSVIGAANSEFTLRIRTWVGQIIDKKKDVDFLGSVSQVLVVKIEEKNDSSRFAEEILSQYPIFKRAETQIFLARTADRKSDDILRELQISNKDALRKCYQIYEQEYERIINDIVQKFDKPGDKETLTSAINTAHAQAKQLLSTTHYSKSPKEIASMVANIFGVWSYLDAHSGGFKSDRNTLKQPHASQVIGVLLLLGMDDVKEAIENHFLQIKTGEGKSVVTAAASIAFALLGYYVHVACYNPWLARRDEKAFDNLFRQFNLESKIIYGDFDHHVELQISKMGDLRSLTTKLLRGESFNRGNKADNQKSLLFVDEVDVFFSESFLGAQYNPAVGLSNSNYKNLLIEIWNNRNQYLLMDKEKFCNSITSHSLYKAFIREYPNLDSFINPFINDIFDGLQQVSKDAHKYIVVPNEGIGYEDKVANTIRTSTFYGHNTAFAAIKEFQAGRLPQSKLDYYAEIKVTCGHFSYAQLPKLFDMIVGVTGTLFSLSAFENHLLDDYRIKRKTDIPSVFTKQKLQGAENVFIYGGDIDAKDDGNGNGGYFYSIKKSVEAAMAIDRAVLLVFETEKRLEAYQKFIINLPYSSKGIRTNTLLTATKDNDRDLIVAEAAQRSRVTLFIREFGRGTDFVCRDSQLRKSGGVAVICTFFPAHPAEEVQIKGRTNRQIDPGSFEMILFLDDLKEFGINSINETEQTPSKYKYLVQKREEYQAKKAEEIQKNLDSTKTVHEETVKLAGMLTQYSLFSRSISESQKGQALEVLRSFNGYKR